MQLGLTAGRRVGRRVGGRAGGQAAWLAGWLGDEIQVNFEIFKIGCRLKYSSFSFN